MTQEQQFLDQIETESEDRRIYHSYAGWLEECGDPRGEYIRVQESMRNTPVFSDRYWELKTRREELAGKCPNDWLNRLRYGSNYQPVFQAIPNGWKERWRLLREFTERWHGIPMGDAGGDSKLARKAERRLKIKLPPSVREWLAYCEELLAKSVYDQVIRDYLTTEDLKELSAISLLQAGEGDFYWAVRKEEMQELDPAVHWYGERWASKGPQKLDHLQRIAPHVTGFVLKYLCMYLNMTGKGTAFSIQGEPDEGLLETLSAAFPVCSAFDDLRVFESKNILVTVGESHGAHQVSVHTRNKASLSDLPECLQRLQPKNSGEKP